MTDQPTPNPYLVKLRPGKALIRGVPVEVTPPTLADYGMSIDADGNVRDGDGNLVVRVIGDDADAVIDALSGSRD